MNIDNVFVNGNAAVFGTPYIIAEAGVNHEGSMELAKRLIDDAAEGGAHAIKFQTYKAETIASKHSPSYWDLSKEPTTSQYALFKKYDKFWKNEFEQLKRYCDDVGIEFMSTPFDVESANFLSDLMSVYKISSSDITNFPFIKYLTSFNKPIILSVGASYLWEVARAVEWIKSSGNKLALLHCVLNYPTSDENANLGMITDLRTRFPDCVIGYSDHTMPGTLDVLEMATLLGAKIIEKHFTHDKSLPGNDHYHAMDKNDLSNFKQLLARIELLYGAGIKTALPSESPARLNARRSLVATRRIVQNEVVRSSDLTWKRPAHGISPSEFDLVVGKIAARDIEEDSLIVWQDLK